MDGGSTPPISTFYGGAPPNPAGSRPSASHGLRRTADAVFGLRPRIIYGAAAPNGALAGDVVEESR